MASTSYLIVCYTLIGISVSISPRALRNLNNKINLLKTTFQRELSSQKTTFQREIDDLKFDVIDLKAELHIEKARASRLEELLNETDIDYKPDTSATRINKHGRQGPSMSPTEVQDMQQKALYKAFQDVKKRDCHALKEIEEAKKVDQTLTVEIANITNTVKSISSQVETNTDNIAVLWNDTKGQDTSATRTNKHGRQGPSMSPTESGIIQQHTRDIKEIRDSIERHEVSISDNKNTIQTAQDMQQKELDEAFQDVKKREYHALKEIEEVKQVDKKLAVEIANITNTVKSISSQVETNTDNIAVLWNDTKDQAHAFNEALDDAATQLKYQTDTIAMLKARLDYRLSDLESTSTTLTTTTQSQTSTSVSLAHKKCRQAIRDGGEAMANLLYLYMGVIVKRGKNWKWGSQVTARNCLQSGGYSGENVILSRLNDRGGHGSIIKLPEDLEVNWVRVLWDDNSANNYRMGVGGAYDLAIVEEKFDFAQCK